MYYIINTNKKAYRFLHRYAIFMLIKHILDFFEETFAFFVVVVFKGRQTAFANTMGADLISKFLGLFEEDAVQVVQNPKLEGNTYTTAEVGHFSCYATLGEESSKSLKIKVSN